MTRTEIEEYARELGIGVDSYAPGDGVRRYRFFTEQPFDYFGGRGVYTALGAKEAATFLAGVAIGLGVGSVR